MLFGNLIQKHKEKKIHARNVEILKHALLNAARSGRFTDEQRFAFAEQQETNGVYLPDLMPWRMEILRTGVESALENCALTPRGEAGLKSITDFLCIHETEIPTDIKATLTRANYLHSLRENADGPPLIVENLILTKAENVFWYEMAELYEERVTGRHYEGGSAGLSFHVAKGVNLRVGQHKGHIVSDKAIIPVARGNLVITSKRIVFMGDSKSFSTPLAKLIELHPFSDGLRMSDSGHPKPRLLKFNGPNGDFFAQILQLAIDRHE